MHPPKKLAVEGAKRAKIDFCKKSSRSFSSYVGSSTPSKKLRQTRKRGRGGEEERIRSSGMNDGGGGGGAGAGAVECSMI